MARRENRGLTENLEDSIPYVLKSAAVNLLLVYLHIHSVNKAFFIVSWLPEMIVGRGVACNSQP